MVSRISVDPYVHFGKPCVAGTRIPVQDVLELIGEGIPVAKIISDYYVELTSEDVQACTQCMSGENERSTGEAPVPR